MLRLHWNQNLHTKHSHAWVITFGLLLLLNAPSIMYAEPLTEEPAPESLSPLNQAQPSVPLKASVSLSQALDLAEDHNIQLQAAQKELDLSQFDVNIAKRLPNPQYAGIYTAGKLYTQLSFPQQFGINQLIETAGKRRKRTDVAQAQLQLADLQYNALRWSIRSQVRQAYAELLAAEQTATLVGAQETLLDRLVDVTDKRVKAGAAPGAELYQAKLARNQLVTQKIEANGKVEQTKAKLNSLLDNNLPDQFQISDTGLFQVQIIKTEVAPPPSLALPEKDAMYQQAVQGRTDLKALEQEQVVAQKQLRFTKAKRVPDLLLSAGYQYAITPQNFNGQRYFPGPYVSTTFELPVFHNQGAEISKVKTTMTQNELRIRDLERQIRLDVDTAYAGLKTAHQNIQFFQADLIPEARKVLHLAERSYQVGKTPLANVIIAQQSLQEVISNYTQTVINYQNAWGDLERAVGSPLNAW